MNVQLAQVKKEWEIMKIQNGVSVRSTGKVVIMLDFFAGYKILTSNGLC
jgi:hypothetical protein